MKIYGPLWMGISSGVFGFFWVASYFAFEYRLFGADGIEILQFIGFDNVYHTGRMRGNWKENVSNAACATTFAHMLDPFTIPISFYLTKKCHERFVKTGFWAEHCEPAI